MRYRDLLNEAPLADISYHPAEKTGAFNSRELALIKKYMADDTYKTRLAKIPFDLYVYIIDDADAAEFGKNYPEGEVAKQFWSDINATHVSPEIKVDPKALSIVYAAIRERKKTNPKAAHFILGDNFSAENQIAPTPWIIAHRFLHATIDNAGADMLHTGMSNLQQEAKVMLSYAAMVEAVTKLFTFASARNGKVVDEFELGVEIGCQYLLTGSVKLNDDSVVRDAIHAIAKAKKIKLSEKAVDSFIGRIHAMIDIMKDRVDDLANHTAGNVYYI